MFEFKTADSMAQAYTSDVAIGKLCPYVFDNKGIFSLCRGKKCMKWVWTEDEKFGYCGRT
jgi:hypothetical protein